MRIAGILGLILWLILGYFLCNKFLCPATDGATKSAAAAPIGDADCKYDLEFIFEKDGEELINLVSADNFSFRQSEFNFEEPSAELSSTVEKVVAFLDNNPDIFIEITGLFYSSDENKSSESNLGKARANQIVEYFISKGANAEQLQGKGVKAQKSACMKDGVIRRGAVAVLNNK